MCLLNRSLQQSSSLSIMETRRGYLSWASAATKGRCSKLPNISRTCRHQIRERAFNTCENVSVNVSERNTERSCSQTLKACSSPEASSKAWQKTAPSRRSVSSTLSLNSLTSSLYSCRADSSVRRSTTEPCEQTQSQHSIFPFTSDWLRAVQQGVLTGSYKQSKLLFLQ